MPLNNHSLITSCRAFEKCAVCIIIQHEVSAHFPFLCLLEFIVSFKIMVSLFLCTLIALQTLTLLCKGT